MTKEEREKALKALEEAYNVIENTDESIVRAYEAREKELMDQRTREYEKYQKGEKKGKKEMIQGMLIKQLDLNLIAEISKISIEEIEEMKRELENRHD